MPEFDRAGARLHYEIEGEGPLLVALHGFTGSAESFSGLARALRARRRVARLDLLGHGRSGAPLDPARYGVWEAAQDVLALLDELGAPQADVLGYSLGGRIALRAALLSPRRVASLVVESASPGIASEAERRRRRASDEDLARLLDERGIAAFVDRWERVPLFATQARCPPARLDSQRAQRLSQRPQGLACSLRGAGAGQADDIAPRLGEIAVPALLIAGALDENYRELLQGMAQRMRQARCIAVRGAGHNVHFEKPRIYARIVSEFLAQRAH